MDGRYDAITSTLAADCGQKGGGGDTAAAVAVGAAALIGVIALAHKSHNHDDGQHYSDSQSEADCERGYRDGLYNQSYHNYSRSDAYANGYSAGVEQRNQETAYRPNHPRWAMATTSTCRTFPTRTGTGRSPNCRAAASARWIGTAIRMAATPLITGTAAPASASPSPPAAAG